MFKLDKKVKAKWVKALRSGKYEQGVGYLKNQVNGEMLYCCLGVACEIGLAQPAGGICTTEFLDKEVQGKLAVFNDGSNSKSSKSFNWIASYIERYL